MSNKFRLQITQPDEETYTSDHENIKSLLKEIFDEWKGWNWIEKSKFMPNGEFFVCYSLLLNDWCNTQTTFEISSIKELNDELNNVFKQFKNGFEKEYQITTL
ncbi:hypothetical protein LP085_08235 [Achromobacter sp. MY14]|uniref:hypothetical protein n=1 Tax=unclassified Achromobacter TaxID=2626865 RepID=UPI001E37AD17|nr:hypothetical protein [Achromobacter sp. MY14]MCD0496835.1 hypothetical protein [Achromobacter sp. MY14]